VRCGRADRWRTTAQAPPLFGTGQNPFAHQCTLIFANAPNGANSNFAVWRGRIHLLGQRPERDTTCLKSVGRQQVRQRPSEPIEFLHYQRVVPIQIVEAGLQSRSIIGAPDALSLWRC
jgi:hypothetical protein